MISNSPVGKNLLQEPEPAQLPDGVGNYHQLLADLPAAVYATDAHGVITFFNEAAVDLWGRRPEAGKDLWCGSWRIYDVDGKPMDLSECPMAMALREDRAIRGIEIIVERPDGKRHHVLPHPTPLRDGDGVLTGAVNMLVDIGDRVAGEAARRQLAAIVESSDDAIIGKTMDGTITSWNQAAERLFGYTAKEAVGNSILMLIPSDRIDEEAEILEQLRRGTRIDHFETVRRRRDGTLVSVALTVSPIRDRNGRIVGASKIARDVTERQRIQRELEEARDEAQAASRAKDEFFAMLSHELRTPLNPVLLAAESALEDPNLPMGLRGELEIIRENVMLEARLLDDMLDFAKMSRQRLILVKNTVVLESVLSKALRTISADAAEKNLVIDVSFRAGGVCTEGDPVRLQQVFWNVLRNAVKFTPDNGRICVVTRANPERRVFEAEISDTGIGMTRNELQRVFDPFAQGEHAAEGSLQRFGGLGIGMALSRKLVNLHAGQISARSDGLGCGTTFVIELPISELLAHPEVVPSVTIDGVHGAAQEGGRSPGASNKTVLLVDDHRGTCITLSRYLARQGCRVLVAGSLREARALAEGNQIDILISDIGLPDGRGTELLELVRRSWPAARGIAVSGYGTASDVESSRRAGFDEHCTKPITLKQLRDALAKVGIK